MIGGTIKQAVQKLLEANDRPMHIFEIAQILSSHRNVTVNSIARNLQVDSSNIFRYFGQLFYGLKNKNYTGTCKYKRLNNKWFLYLKKLYLQEGTYVLNKTQAIRQLSSYYQIETIQIEYALYERIQKGHLYELENDLLQLNQACIN